MKIRLQDGLLFIPTSLTYQGQQVTLDNVLLDTGSAGTIFSTDKVLVVGLQYEANDTVHRIHGVGGSEFVFTKRVDRLTVNGLHIDAFEVELGAMDDGIEIDGIIGLDFLISVGAVIDLAQLEVSQGKTTND
jgi:hypothetical protein